MNTFKVQAAAYGLVFVLAVVLGPALLIALFLQGYARYQGWPASRLRNVAVATSAALAFGIAWATAMAADWMTVPNMLGTAITEAFHGDLSWSGSLGLFPWIELPLAAGLAWYGLRRREVHMVQHNNLREAQRFYERTRRNQRRSALRRERNELTPMSRGNEVVLGHQYRQEGRQVELASDALTARHQVWLALTLERLNRHMTLVGSTGAGKTELLKRLSCGWTEAAWRRFDQEPRHGLGASVPGTGGDAAGDGGPRPLTIFVQAKGGRDSAEAAFAWSDRMEALGLSSERVGVFPFQDGLNMWNLPADQLRECLHEMCGTDHRFYDVLQRGLLSLLLDSDQGVPRSSVEFLERVNPRWLRNAWHAHPTKLEQVKQIEQLGTLSTDLILFEDLFRSLAGDVDAGRSLVDFDALYVALNGTGQQRVASCKAKLLVELIKYELTASQRQVLLVFDEFSAVSDLVDMRQLVRTSRELGASLLLSAQSYYGLGSSTGEVDELLADMRGGHLVMAGSAMEPWSKICGARKRPEVGAHLDIEQASGFSSQGTARLQDQFIASPDELKDLPEHDVALIEPGSATFGHVVPVDQTQRGPSRLIVDHPQQALPAEGRAVALPELLAGRQRVLDAEQRGGQ